VTHRPPPGHPRAPSLWALAPLAERSHRTDDVVARCAQAFATDFAVNPARPRLTAIAQATGCSRNSVRGYLVEAQRRGLLMLAVRIPADETLSDRLASRYGLAEAVVTLTPTKWSDQASVRAALSAEAMWYLERACSRFAERRGEGSLLRIGIDGGLTLYKAAHEATPSRLPQLTYELVPLVFGPLEGSSYTATVVANVLASKLESLGLSTRVCDPFVIRRESRKRGGREGRIQLTLEMHRKVARDLDLLFVGIGSKNAGLFHRDMQLQGRRHRSRRYFGDILSLGFDSQGRELALGTRTRSVLLNLQELQSLSTSQRALVVGVAGGEAKVESIRAVLAGKYVSVLITDIATATALLERA